MDLGRPWVVRLLLGLRALPARWARAAGGQPPAEGGVTRPVRAVAFTVIAEQPGVELVLGLRGRFWTPTGGVVTAPAGEFHHPPPAGQAHAVWSFRLEPRDGGTHLVTETRVRCADAATRRSFLRYWGLIRFGSGWTRRSMLRLIRRTAERATG